MDWTAGENGEAVRAGSARRDGFGPGDTVHATTKRRAAVEGAGTGVFVAMRELIVAARVAKEGNSSGTDVDRARPPAKTSADTKWSIASIVRAALQPRPFERR